MAAPLELRSQFTVVVDFAVEYELDAVVGACERLIAGLAQIDDRQSPKGERITYPLRPAMTTRFDATVPVPSTITDRTSGRVY
jgi:hypothetical protein